MREPNAGGVKGGGAPGEMGEQSDSDVSWLPCVLGRKKRPQLSSRGFSLTIHRRKGWRGRVGTVNSGRAGVGTLLEFIFSILIF